MQRLITFLVLCMASWPCLAARPQRPMLPATADVRFIADQYVASLPRSAAPEQIAQAKADFIWFFLEGFTNSQGAISGSNDAIDKGFSAGQAYRRLNPEKFDRTMVGFGYSAVRLRGAWQTDFELSGFIPATQPNARWWLSILGDSPASRSNISPAECRSVQVVGFLSPTGSYGHMGAFSHEIFVKEITCLERANNSFKPKPLRGSA